MKKLLTILAVLVVLPLAGLTAQQKAFSLFSVDLGYAPAYSLNDNKYYQVSTFGLNIKVTDSITAGFNMISTSDVNLLNFKYDVLPQVRVTLGTGVSGASALANVGLTNSSPLISLGLEGIPFQKNTNGLGTEVKLALQYVFAPTASNSLGKGVLFFGLNACIGM